MPSPDYHEMSPDDLWAEYQEHLLNGDPAPLDLIVALEAHGLMTDLGGLMALSPNPKF